jgi:subtilase family serine protease
MRMARPAAITSTIVAFAVLGTAALGATAVAASPLTATALSATTRSATTRSATTRSATTRSATTRSATTRSATTRTTTLDSTGTASGGLSRWATAAGTASTGGILSPGFTNPSEKPFATPPTTAQCQKQYKIACYSPTQIEAAYGLPQLFSVGVTGAGQTIAVVDVFGSPTVAADLATFDQAFSLPAPPSLKIITPAGSVGPYRKTRAREAWANETELDVDYAHAMAPGANILLVEVPNGSNAATQGWSVVLKGEQAVISEHLADVITQSFGTPEAWFPSASTMHRLNATYADAEKNGITVLDATGDVGATMPTTTGSYYPQREVAFPASDPLVTAVGGTELHLNASGTHTSPDTVWNDTYNKNVQEHVFGDGGPNPFATSGGVSSVFSRPSYQDGVSSLVGDQRGLPDISMSGGCAGEVLVYESFPGTTAGWYPVCGTSESSPLFSGIVALADQVNGGPLGLINPALYAMSAAQVPGLVDVTSGDNSVTYTVSGTKHTVTGYQAGLGYDLASGVGTVYAPDFVPELVQYVKAG